MSKEVKNEPDLDPVVSEVKHDGIARSSSDSPYLSSSSDVHMTKWQKFIDGFREQKTENNEQGQELSKGISQRHLITLALITGVGTGLLVGTGKVLHNAGPSQIILGFAIVGSYVYPTLQAAGELAISYANLPGGYNGYTSRLVEPSFAFAVSWNYCIQWLTVVAVELVTASMTIQFWLSSSQVNPDVWVTIFYIVVLFINLIGAKGYGEAEFIIGCTKLVMIVGFIIMGICLTAGANPHHEFIGGQNWINYWNFKGLCTVFVTGSFALGQSEFIALTAAEQKNPRKAIPMACKLIFWRVLIIFLGSLTFVGLLVPYTSDKLMGSGSSSTHASPFVLAAELHGVTAVPSIINAVILMSVTSVASSAFYSGSRTLHSLSVQGSAPAWFSYIDKQGRPLRAMGIFAVIGLFSYIAAYDQQETVFAYLLSISGLSQIFTWSSICLSHIRFRQALKYHNISVDSLGYVSQTGVWGSAYALVCQALVIIAQFWIALFPVGSGSPSVENFFQNYLGPVVLVVFYVGHKIYTRDLTLLIKVKDIDIFSDRVLYDEEVLTLERQEAEEELKNGPFYKRVLHFLFV